MAQLSVCQLIISERPPFGLVGGARDCRNGQTNSKFADQSERSASRCCVRAGSAHPSLTAQPRTHTAEAAENDSSVRACIGTHGLKTSLVSNHNNSSIIMIISHSHTLPHISHTPSYRTERWSSTPTFLCRISLCFGPRAAPLTLQSAQFVFSGEQGRCLQGGARLRMRGTSPGPSYL